MEKLLEKISSYNILNNLLPGAIFVYLCQLLDIALLSMDSIIENLFIYYFWGLVASRIGSLVVEKVLMYFGKITYSSKADYVMATQEDKLIEVLLEVGNLYRACSGVCLMLGIVKVYTTILCPHIPATTTFWISIVALFILFVASFCKQTQHIKKRVDVAIQKAEKET